MSDQITTDYIASLPDIDTSRLPVGALFWAQDRIYQVIESAAGGYHKAREWRKTETTDVALIPGSFPSRFLPLVTRGRLLPVYRSRLELTSGNEATCFVFPTENLALDAAYFDVALVQSAGAYVRNQGHDPAFSVTDGVHIYRLYYYRVSGHGRKTDLSSLQVRPLPFRPQVHTDGPGYWRLLSSWTEIAPTPDITQQMIPVRPRSKLEDTMPHISTDPPSR